MLVAKLFLFQTDLAVPVDVEVEFHRMVVAQAGSKWRSLKPVDVEVAVVQPAVAQAGVDLTKGLGAG